MRAIQRLGVRATAVAALLMLGQPGAAQVFNWSSGTFLAGTTAPSPLLPGQELNINNGGFKYFDGLVSHFSNQSTVNWTADTLYLQNGVQVASSGLWLSTANTTLAFNGGAASSFTNQGTFRKSVGVGTTTVADGVGFVNSGTIDAQTGVINFAGGSTFNAGTVFSGAGVVRMSAGTNQFNGGFTSSNLELVSGTFNGNAAVLTGNAGWRGGTVSGGWTVANGQTLNINNGGFKYVDGAGTVLTNNGTATWNDDVVYLQNGAQVVNNGLWDARSNHALSYNGGTVPSVTNNGTFRKSAGAGNTTVSHSLGFINNGTIDAQTGDTITVLDAAGQLSGAFAQVTLNGFGTGAFDVIYDLVGDRVQLLVTEQVVVAIPEPQTYALMGLGLLFVGGVAARRRRLAARALP